MHFIFEKSAKITGHKEMPYTKQACFPPQQHGFSLNNQVCKNRDEWIAEASRLLGALGINDYGYSLQELSGIPAVTFHFVKQRDQLQFEAIAFADKKKQFIRSISSESLAHSSRKIDLVLQFAAARDIKVDVRHVSDKQISVTTYSSYDDLAIRQRLIQGGFNVGRVDIESPYVRADNPPKQLAALFLPRLAGPKKG